MNRAHVLVPLAGLLALAGCSPSPSTAAKVGDVVVSEQAVTKIAEGCSPLIKERAATLRPAVVQALVRGAIAREVAASSGIKIDPDTVAKMTKQGDLAKLAADPECAKVVASLAELDQLTSRIKQDEFFSAANRVMVEVNPRYGNWNPEALALQGSGSISAPAGKPLL